MSRSPAFERYYLRFLRKIDLEWQREWAFINHRELICPSFGEDWSSFSLG